MNFDCPICTEQGDPRASSPNGLCMVQNCGHVFHQRCINEWLSRRNKTCPTCRQPCKKTWPLYGSTMDNGPENEANGNNDNANIQQLYETVQKNYSELQENYHQVFEDLQHEIERSELIDGFLEAEKEKVEELGKQIRELTTKLQEMDFKLSMYGEYFGPEPEQLFTDLIEKAKNE